MGFKDVSKDQQTSKPIVCCQQRPANQLCAVKFHWGTTYNKNVISSPWSMIVISQTGPCGCPYNKNVSYKNKSIISISKPPILRRDYQKINPIFTLQAVNEEVRQQSSKFLCCVWAFVRPLNCTFKTLFLFQRL